MSKFKVGDKVKILPGQNSSDWSVGEEFIITGIDEDLYISELRDEGLYEHEIELVEDTPIEPVTMEFKDVPVGGLCQRPNAGPDGAVWIKLNYTTAVDAIDMLQGDFECDEEVSYYCPLMKHVAKVAKEIVNGN